MRTTCRDTRITAENHGLIADIVTDGDASHDWNSQRAKTLSEHVGHRDTVRTRAALSEVSDDHRGCARQMSAGDEGREHPIDAIGPFADVLQQQHAAARNAQMPRSGAV